MKLQNTINTLVYIHTWISLGSSTKQDLQEAIDFLLALMEVLEDE